jgi:hypothetical protein
MFLLVQQQQDNDSHSAVAHSRPILGVQSAQSIPPMARWPLSETALPPFATSAARGTQVHRKQRVEIAWQHSASAESNTAAERRQPGLGSRSETPGRVHSGPGEHQGQGHGAQKQKEGHKHVCTAR